MPRDAAVEALAVEVADRAGGAVLVRQQDQLGVAREARAASRNRTRREPSRRQPVLVRLLLHQLLAFAQLFLLPLLRLLLLAQLFLLLCARLLLLAQLLLLPNAGLLLLVQLFLLPRALLVHVPGGVVVHGALRRALLPLHAGAGAAARNSGVARACRALRAQIPLMLSCGATLSKKLRSISQLRSTSSPPTSGCSMTASCGAMVRARASTSSGRMTW